jgi:hypothetical protein
MYRTAHRGIAALALVLMLTLVGAQPAAAADRGFMDRFAGFWGAVFEIVPGAHAVLDTLTGWFHVTENSVAEPQPTINQGWGIDPNGADLQPEPVPSGKG